MPPKAARRYDDCLTYSMVSAKKALKMAGLDPKDNADAFEASSNPHFCGCLAWPGLFHSSCNLAQYRVTSVTISDHSSAMPHAGLPVSVATVPSRLDQ